MTTPKKVREVRESAASGVPARMRRKVEAELRYLRESDVLFGIPLKNRWDEKLAWDARCVAEWLAAQVNRWQKLTYREALEEMFDVLHAIKHNPNFQPEVLAMERIIQGDIFLFELPGTTLTRCRGKAEVSA